mmetsp:Transcript_2392/g.4323  ORF Transcript_2392/g.4323 Transcript_2392/m.4323 type:complete len:292 (-) Transcript_2392:896-1771(-)
MMLFRVLHGPDGVYQTRPLRPRVLRVHVHRAVLESPAQFNRVQSDSLALLECGNYARGHPTSVRGAHGGAMVLRLGLERVPRDRGDGSPRSAKSGEEAVGGGASGAEAVRSLRDVRSGKHAVLRLHHLGRNVSADAHKGGEAAGGAKGGEGGSVVPRRGEHRHAPLSHRVVESFRHLAAVGLPKGLAVGEVNEVAVLLLGCDERSDEALPRLSRVEPAVAYFYCQDLCSACDAVFALLPLEISSYNSSHVGAVRTRVRDYADDVPALINLHAVGNFRPESQVGNVVVHLER